MDKRQSGAHIVQVFLVEPLSFLGKESRMHCNAGGAQMLETLSRNAWVQILIGRYDPLNTGLDKRTRTGSSPPMMCMRLEGNIRGTSASSVPGLLQGHRLGMLHIFVDVEPLTGNFAAGIHNDTTNEWSRTNTSDTICRELERPGHHAPICLSPLGPFFSQCRCCKHKNPISRI